MSMDSDSMIGMMRREVVLEAKYANNTAPVKVKMIWVPATQPIRWITKYEMGLTEATAAGGRKELNTVLYMSGSARYEDTVNAKLRLSRRAKVELAIIK